MSQLSSLLISELWRAGYRPRGGRLLCGDYPEIDARHLSRTKVGNRISCRWHCGGEPVLTVDLELAERVVALSTGQTITVLRTACHYGGTRTWFECPACQRRCLKLHWLEGRFSCRRCHGLAYRSQLDASRERPRLIAQRLRRSLGGSPDLFNAPFPAKPHRMHWRTYDRIREKGEKYRNRAILGMAAQMGLRPSR